MKEMFVKKHIQKLVTTAMLMSVGIVLPFFTGQIPQIGNMLLPMHIPVLVCGLICGWQYGSIMGFILPLLRCFLCGTPAMPKCIGMAFELAVYGGISGFLYNRSKWKCIISLYRSLIAAIITGRFVWGIMRILLFKITDVEFSWQIFVASGFLNAIPGIILQLVFIPVLMVALNKTGIVHFHANHSYVNEKI